MSFDVGAYSEEEKKNKKIIEKKESNLKNQKNEQQKIKEYISTETETEEDLHMLSELVNGGVMTQEQANHIKDKEQLSQDDVREIFNKIDEMESLKNIDKYLPSDVRISKEDYTKAMVDDIFRIQTITKLDTALAIIGNQIIPDGSAGLNLFSGFLTMLDKNLVLLQENTVEIKVNLKKIHERKFPKQKLYFFEKIINFLKEIFK